jgi:transposase
MRIIRAIVSGTQTPDTLATFRDARCAASEETIREALTGNYRPEHVFALRHALELYDFHHAKIAECDTEIEVVLRTLNEDRPTQPDQATLSEQPLTTNSRVLVVLARLGCA